MIGTYEKNEKFRLVISNARCDQPTSFALTLTGSQTAATVFTSIEAKPTGKAALQWTLAPGGSVLLDVE